MILPLQVLLQLENQVAHYWQFPKKAHNGQRVHRPLLRVDVCMTSWLSRKANVVPSTALNFISISCGFCWTRFRQLLRSFLSTRTSGEVVFSFQLVLNFDLNIGNVFPLSENIDCFTSLFFLHKGLCFCKRNELISLQLAIHSAQFIETQWVGWTFVI